MFSGVGTALITPFDRDFNVDYNSLRKVCQHQVAGKVDAIIVLGTTGESPVFSIDERKKIIETVIDEVKGKTKIIIGTGSNDTKKVVDLNKIAEEFKADGVLVVNPYYNKGTQESLVAHYKYISERTSLPILLYNVPSRTGMNVLPETIVNIAEACKNVIGVKEACSNIAQIAQLMSIKPKNFAVWSGNDNETLPIMALGGSGVISVFSNAYPAELKTITEAMLKSDLAAAQELSNKYMGMMNALFVETSPIPIKYVMHKLGLCQNILRLPLVPATHKVEKLLDIEMKVLSA
jgi:4-hydroxy-tetrahydrodipicolinate synthase